MGPGLPGLGIASLFYVAAALLAPIRELYLTVLGRSSAARWRTVAVQFAIATMTVAGVIGLFIGVDVLIEIGFFSVARGPEFFTRIPNWVYAIVACVVVLVGTSLVAKISESRGGPEDPALVAALHRSNRIAPSSLGEEDRDSGHHHRNRTRELQTDLHVHEPHQFPPSEALAATAGGRTRVATSKTAN